MSYTDRADDLGDRFRVLFGTDLFRPRDEMDEWTVPGSLRWHALELRDTVQRLADYLAAQLPLIRSTMAYARQRPQPVRRPHRRKHGPTRRRTPVR